MNERLLRLLDSDHLQDLHVPGARYFPPAPVLESRLRGALLGAVPDRLTTLTAMRLVDGHSDLSRVVPERTRTYDRALDQDGLWTVESGDLRGEIRRQAGEWPIDPIVEVRAQGSDLEVTAGSRTQTVVGQLDGGFWTADWPDFSGIVGSIALASDLFRVRARPYTLDLTGLRDRLQADSSLQPLFIETQTDRYFYRARTAAEAVAAALCCLMLSNKDVQYV